VKKVVVIDAGYESYDYERGLLAEADCALDVVAGEADRATKIAAARGASGLLVRGTLIDAAFLDAVPGLEAVVRYGVGYDNVDLAAATERGVKVANVQGYASHSVSDHALALVFGCLRGLVCGHNHIRTLYGGPPRPEMPELKDLTLGIVGLGRIGGTLCEKAQRLFRRVLASDPYIDGDRFTTLGATQTDLATLLGESDVISLHCNLTEETTHLIDARAFAQTKRTPILVNTARGPVIDEAALLEALNDGVVHSAGLDVFAEEPPGPAYDALLSHPHVIATGHYAWYSEPASAELQRRATQNMLAFMQGKIPEDCLNP
jgi:D-3-phosphoglycerate dehydrogenase / 2-oxoglutarate reductase